MQRGSDRHGPRVDEDLKKEFESTEHANRPTRAHEWRDPEPEEPEDEEIQVVPGEDSGTAGAETGDHSRSTSGGAASDRGAADSQ